MQEKPITFWCDGDQVKLMKNGEFLTLTEDSSYGMVWQDTVEPVFDIYDFFSSEHDLDIEVVTVSGVELDDKFIVDFIKVDDELLEDVLAKEICREVKLNYIVGEDDEEARSEEDTE